MAHLFAATIGRQSRGNSHVQLQSAHEPQWWRTAAVHPELSRLGACGDGGLPYAVDLGGLPAGDGQARVQGCRATSRAAVLDGSAGRRDVARAEDEGPARGVGAVAELDDDVPRVAPLDQRPRSRLRLVHATVRRQHVV